MLFYEPKFPKYSPDARRPARRCPFSALLRAEIPKIERYAARQSSTLIFQCSSTSRNSQNRPHRRRASIERDFQCSSTSRNSQNAHRVAARIDESPLSVLFYEPKFPKSHAQSDLERGFSYDFQCSSTSRNSQNRLRLRCTRRRSAPFSALLRAEIPKIARPTALVSQSSIFQCSSTSRNSQNLSIPTLPRCWRSTFSALLRAEIPKITLVVRGHILRLSAFSALLRAEIPKILRNSSIRRAISSFQCSSTSRNSQNVCSHSAASVARWLSVLFYEPKFPKSTA